MSMSGVLTVASRSSVHSRAARDRGLFRVDAVESLLAEPNRLTTLRYNQLWQIGLLELWLQTHGIA